MGRGSQCPKGAGLCPGAHEGTFVALFGSCRFVLEEQEWGLQGGAEVGCTGGYEEGDACCQEASCPLQEVARC